MTRAAPLLTGGRRPASRTRAAARVPQPPSYRRYAPRPASAGPPGSSYAHHSAATALGVPRRAVTTLIAGIRFSAVLHGPVDDVQPRVIAAVAIEEVVVAQPAVAVSYTHLTL